MVFKRNIIKEKVILLIGIISIVACPGCTDCEYENRTIEVYISSYSLENDSVVSTVYFSPVDKNEERNHIWVSNRENQNRTLVWLQKHKFEKFDIDFSEEVVRDTSIKYRIKGNFIVEGTCSPSSIEAIEVVKK